ncbi:vegetative cell wall protein gp1-like [Eucalyptus grandis]|uniref:vegetative cell wall protein gp1-like n=1 Tax=Eucalyptus grandis TaxID=71139 RepID=UPI00192EA317|nr:vegetative cell wall protein gp1-like [Eucalyptus grandis]
MLPTAAQPSTVALCLTHEPTASARASTRDAPAPTPVDPEPIDAPPPEPNPRSRRCPISSEPSPRAHVHAPRSTTALASLRPLHVAAAEPLHHPNEAAIVLIRDDPDAAPCSVVPQSLFCLATPPCRSTTPDAVAPKTSDKMSLLNPTPCFPESKPCNAAATAGSALPAIKSSSTALPSPPSIQQPVTQHCRRVCQPPSETPLR